MDHAHAHELGIREAGDHAEDALLLAPLELGLEAHHREMAGRQVVLPELHHRERSTTRARIDEADRLHGPEAQRVAPAAGDDLDGQAALEEELVLEGVQLGALGRGQGLMEAVVLRLVERAVDVVVAPLAVARGAEGAREVDRLRLHHGAHRVVEVEVRLADEGGDLRRQRVRGEGSGGHDRDGILRQRDDLAAVDPDLGQRLHRLRHLACEEGAVDGERASRGHAHLVRDADDERAHAAHLFLEQPRRLIERVAAEAVRADELGQIARLVDRCGPDGPHLAQVDADTAARELPGRFAAREPPADDGDAIPQAASRL